MYSYIAVFVAIVAYLILTRTCESIKSNRSLCTDGTKTHGPRRKMYVDLQNISNYHALKFDTADPRTLNLKKASVPTRSTSQTQSFSK